MSLKVIADDKIPFLRDALEPFLDIEYMPGASISNEAVRKADALIIRTRTKCNESLLEGSAVKFIATATIGYDHIDTEYCKKKGISWTNAPGCNSGSVMQYVASAILSWARGKEIDLTERVIGIVGVGNVGQKILKLSEMLDMHIVLNDPPRVREEGLCGFLSLEGVLREADILTLHVPLSKEGVDKTWHLADEKFFRNLNHDTLFVNTSRGEVADTLSLKAALENNHPSAAVLDVWEHEPEIDTGLLEKCYIGTPHIAGYSVDGKANGTRMSVQALSRFFELGIDEWEPSGLPEPEDPVLYCDGSGKSFQEILTELVLQTYDVREEIKWLREDVTKFEQYRGSYPPRREFPAYRVVTKNMDDNSLRKLRRLGFKITNESL